MVTKFALNKANILCAYPYFKSDVVKLLTSIDREKYRLIVDSGAFTVYNSGIELCVEGYCEFLDSISHLKPFKAVCFDVFGNPDKSWENFLFMHKKGYDVMPVFTRGEDEKRLDLMYEYTDYIMFGGIVVGRDNYKYVKWFSERNKGRKVHWLGFNNNIFMKHYKPEAVDSSSWMGGQRFGRLDVYRGFGEFIHLSKQDFMEQPSKLIRDYLKDSNFPDEQIDLLGKDQAWKGGAKPYNGDSVRGLSSFMSSTNHLKRAFDVENNIGSKVYLACGNTHHIRALFQAQKQLQEGV